MLNYLHSPGFLQYPCNLLQLGLQMAGKKIKLIIVLFLICLFDLRLSQWIPVQPSLHLHSKGFLQYPLTQPGKDLQDSQVSPLQPIRHLKLQNLYHFKHILNENIKYFVNHKVFDQIMPLIQGYNTCILPGTCNIP